MNWLTNIPISSADIDRKIALQNLEREKKRAKEIEQITEEIKKIIPKQEPVSPYKRYSQSSSLGLAGGITIFGAPINILR